MTTAGAKAFPRPSLKFFNRCLLRFLKIVQSPWYIKLFICHLIVYFYNKNTAKRGVSAESLTLRPIENGANR
jgi:hypothetical protein